jgi:uncharacterized repeat protein (TIGR01451 family)
MRTNTRATIIVAAALALLVAAVPALAQNAPVQLRPDEPAASNGFFNSLTGVSDLTTTSTVNYTFTVTGTTNDGSGDSVELQIWDDGTKKAFKTHSVPVGQTQTFTDSITWAGPIGTVAPCIGVILADMPAGSSMAVVDPFCMTGELPLSIAKTAPASAMQGSLLTYTIAYGNTTAAPIDGVVITDTVPSGTTFVSATGGGTLSGGVVTWNIGTIPANTTGLTVTFTVNVTAASGLIVNDTYSIAGTGVSALAGSPARTSVTASAAISQVPGLNLPGLAILVALVAAAGVLFLVRGRAGV